MWIMLGFVKIFLIYMTPECNQGQSPCFILAKGSVIRLQCENGGWNHLFIIDKIYWNACLSLVLWMQNFINFGFLMFLALVFYCIAKCITFLHWKLCSDSLLVISEIEDNRRNSLFSQRPHGHSMKSASFFFLVMGFFFFIEVFQ